MKRDYGGKLLTCLRFACRGCLKQDSSFALLPCAHLFCARCAYPSGGTPRYCLVCKKEVTRLRDLRFRPVATVASGQVAIATGPIPDDPAPTSIRD